MSDDQLLAKGVLLTLRIVGLALALPDANKGEKSQQAVVQRRALAQVRGIVRYRGIAQLESGDIAASGVLPLLGSLVHGIVAIEFSWIIFRVGGRGGLDVFRGGFIIIFAHGRPA